MEINDELILKLEKLSHLRLDTDERQQMKIDLEAMLNMVGKLNELDTDGVEPLRFISDAVNVLGEDEVSNQLSNEVALSNAPSQQEGFILVPPMMNNK